MTRTVYVMSGLPGSGKTYTRTHDPKLRRLPFVDIEDVYRDYEERFPEFGALDWHSALLKLLGIAHEILQQKKAVVIEGIFWPGSPSRKVLSTFARVHGWTLVYVECKADAGQCCQRVMDDFNAGRKDWSATNIRLRIIERYTTKGGMR